MKTHADAFFAQGKTHMVCQDYALAHTDQFERRSYAIVCDGCSSSPKTDVGARLVAHSTALHMKWLRNVEPTFTDRERMIIDAAANAANEIDLDLRSLDATVVAARTGVGRDGNPGVIVSMRGDGVLVVRHRTNGHYIYTVDHEENAPRYLSYDIDPRRLEGYLGKFGERSYSQIYVSKWGEQRPQDGWEPNLYAGFEGHPEDWFFSAEEWDLVMVLSDGVRTFQRVVRTGTTKTLEDVPVEEVVPHLLAIKGTKGAFVQRRCHKFLSRHCVENEWQHADDFSAAAIYMEAPDV